MPPDGSGAPSDLVIVGRVRRSHGVHGVLVVEPKTAGADEVFTEGRELVAGNVKGEPSVPALALHIAMAEPFQGGYRVQFTEIVGRDEADRWRDRCLLAPRAELPEPDENQIYLHDLIGMQAEREGGEVIGAVEACYELKHDVMIEVRRAGGSVLIPYRFVTLVDVDGKRLVVDPPEGLL